ncbi:Na/Pi cotransporter family protein [Prolixibacteraceae bacterium JC049]|nr:Na/Pi cotransporter family protein [Prolixibacteraceae bacterium JC049]
MEYSMLDFLTLVGSLGMFLYGMKLMSESLQKVAGSRMREILSSMTSNRFKGVLTGILITALVQSSSATTVMVVSFVNAGLLSLIQSIGVIMGANIGTTITAWLISFLGFKVSMGALALPLVGLSLPILFSKNRKRKNWGELLMGFALLFIGLDFLKGAVPDISGNHEVLSFLSDYSSMGYGSYFIFLVMGTLLTVVIQSSSATMALTLVMCNSGWIGFDVAAAMVLGENIGTTITANIAASVANSSAKRAARAHFIFNLFGVAWVLLILPFFLKGIVWFNGYLGGESPYASVAAIPIALSLFHTIFNILNTSFLIWFAPFIARTVEKMVKVTENDDDFTLKHIKIGMLSTPEASIYQAKQESVLFAERVIKMIKHVTRLLSEQNDKKADKLVDKIRKNEDCCDMMEIEIANYLTKVSETRLSETNSKRVRSMFKTIDDIESIADSCMNIASNLVRKRDQRLKFPEEVESNLKVMLGLVAESVNIMMVNLKLDKVVSVDAAKEKEEEINNYRDILKGEHLSNIEKGLYGYAEGIIYTDIVSECERLGDFAINVSEALFEKE